MNPHSLGADFPSRWLLAAGDFTPWGGQDRANHALASRLAQRGAEVHLACHRAADDLKSYANVHIHLFPRPLGSHFLAAPVLAELTARLARRLERTGPLAVVVNGGNVPALRGAINWVHYVHSAWKPAGEGSAPRIAKTRLFHALGMRDEKRAVDRARIVIANSDRTRTDVVDRLGADPAKVFTCYYGIDADRFAPITAEERALARAEPALQGDPQAPIVAFVGALGDRRKGFDTLFQAWSALAAKGDWNARLVVMGAGAGVDIWNKNAAAAGLGDAIRFLGYRKDVPHVLAACDALVAPTRYEAYGLNIHEALCRGLPAIVSANAGVAERYPDSLSSLLLDDPEDAAELAARLTAWRRDREPLAREVQALSAVLRERSWDECADELIALASASRISEAQTRC